MLRSPAWAVGGGEVDHPNDGSVVRTTDGGRTWQNVTPPGGAAEVFRDVEATDGDHAIALAIEPPSQIYRTADGGVTWHVVFEDADPSAFYACVAFFDHRRGIAVSDPVGGRFRLAGTEDGGRSWHVLKNVKIPRFDDKLMLGVDGRRAAGCWAVGGGLAARLSVNR